MKKMMTVKNTRNGVALAAMIALLGCGETTSDGMRTDGPGANPGEEPTVTRPTTLLPDTPYTKALTIYDDVEPIEHDVASLMVKTNNTITLPDATLQSRFQVGDVLVSDYADGIFRVVESMYVEGGELVLTTRPAKLEDAVASGEIYLGKLTSPSYAPPATYDESMQVRRQGLGFTKEFDWQGSLYEYNESFNDQLNEAIPGDTLTVTAANVNAAIGAEFYAEITAKFGWPPVSIPQARVMANGRADATLRFKLQSDEEFHYDETFTLVGNSTQNPFLRVEDIEHTILPRLFPLKITFAMSSTLHVKADVDGAIEAGFGYTLASAANAGVMRKNGEWIWVKEAQLTPLRFGPVFRGEKDLSASATLRNTVNLTLGERANGFLNLEPATVHADFSQRIDADSGLCPTSFNLHAKGTAEGQLESIDVPLLGTKKIMDEAFSYTIYDRELVDYTGQLNLPGICDPNYEPPTHAGTIPSGEKCGGNEECISNECYTNTCVKQGKLRVSTNWDQNTDLDLYLITPSGAGINYYEKQADGGRYDFHNCTYESSCADTKNVESIYFKDDAPDGTYRAFVHHADVRAETSFEFEVAAGGETLNFQGQAPSNYSDMSAVFEFTLRDGKLEGGMSTTKPAEEGKEEKGQTPEG